MRRDRAGNLLIARRRAAPSLFVTAHLDHPAFVGTAARGTTVELEWRGGVHEPYFHDARIEVFDARGRAHPARITGLDAAAVPFRRVTARIERTRAARPSRALAIGPGNIARWRFARREPLPRITRGVLRTYACDDLAGVAAALATMDRLGARAATAHVGLAFTRAVEVGFVGAIAACKAKSISRHARLICLETSRSFPESPVGAGPIVRVGDRSSVFEPALTNAISLLMTEHEKADPGFRWQRKLMPGGTCEATTFSTYGYQATCLCLPLGNYHNMVDIDAVLAGRRPARVGPEFISIDDFHGLVEMLVLCATQLDAPRATSLRGRMEDLYAQHGHVLRAHF
jgi:endoglucanase